VTEASVVELRYGIASGGIDAVELVEQGLGRIRDKDADLKAMIELNPDATEIAEGLDAERRDGTARGPLHGVTVVLKDNIATDDRMETTSGSLALIGATPQRDSFVAKRLREAGAVILGKTNLTEWANIRSQYSISGWSGRGGQTVNPYQLDRNPSGSSSGSGVAVAAGYAPLAVGTETNGSIVSPSGMCGIVGIKPTVGLVSRAGIIPISHMQDTAGPMATTVADAAMLLTVLAGDDPDDPAQRHDGDPGPIPYPARPDGWMTGIDYTAFLDADGLKGARIGVLRPDVTNREPVLGLYNAALDALVEAGSEVVDGLELPHAKDFGRSSHVLDAMLWDFKNDLAAYLRDYVDPDFPIRTLADVIAFNRKHADEEMPWFGQDLFEMAETKGTLDDPEYIQIVSTVQRWGREEGIDLLMREHRLDALVAPTNLPASRIDVVNGDRLAGGSSTASAVAGYPIVTVPMGDPYGLPVGLSFMGGAYSEPDLIRLAYAYEQATLHRKEPAFAAGGLLPPG
jgi:amidase